MGELVEEIYFSFFKFNMLSEHNWSIRLSKMAKP